MKKTLIFLMQFLTALLLQSQTISNYSCKLDNGIIVKEENCWNRVWVNTRYDTTNMTEKTKPLSINIKAIGELGESPLRPKD